MSDQRRIVLTGCSRGLGEAMTAGFVEAGHTVFGCARSVEAIASLAERFPAPHRFDVVDVTSDEGVREWAVQVIAEGGPPDLLINNAAVVNTNAPLWEVSADDFSHVIDVNIKGVNNVLRAFLPAMIEAGRGIVVNFSSGWGRSVSSKVAPYCATKWAIEGLTQALARDLPAGLAAVPLNPGIINTDLLQSCLGAGASHFPTTDAWAKSAVPYLLSLDTSDNGRPLSVPV